MKKLIISLLFLHFLCLPAMGATWYVDKDNDGGTENGTAWGTAWGEFGDIVWGSISSGDTIYVADGTYTTALTVGASGVTVSVAQSEHVGYTGMVYIAPTGAYGIRVSGYDNVTVTGQYETASTQYITVDGTNISGSPCYYIHMNNTDTCDIGYIATDYDSGIVGVGVQIANYADGGNRLHHCLITDAQEDGIDIDFVANLNPVNDDYLRVDHNEITNWGDDGIKMGSGSDSGGVTIDHNEIHAPNAWGSYSDGMQIGSLNYLTVAYNQIYDMENDPDGMYTHVFLEQWNNSTDCSHIYVYNNLLWETSSDCSEAGTNHTGFSITPRDHCTNGMNDVEVSNNTIVDLCDFSMQLGWWEVPVTNSRVFNNIIYNGNREDLNTPMLNLNLYSGQTIGSYGDGTDTEFDYNVMSINGDQLWRAQHNTVNYDSYAAFTTACNCNDHGTSSEPTLAGWTEGNATETNIALSASDTIAKDKGVTRSLFSDDYVGISRPQGSAWDIGAWEVQSSSPVASISATDSSAAEQDTDTGTYTITFSFAAIGDTTVNYTVSGTATSGSDYSALSGTVVVSDGTTTGTITLTPIDDILRETSTSPETVIVTLSSGTGYSIGSPSSATVSIADNDKAMMLTICE